MTTQAQDTHTQDLIDRFTLRMEEIRQDSALRGPMRLLQNAILDFFIAMFRVLAKLAEQRRNGTLPVIAAASVDEPRAWPADLRPRESGWAQDRNPDEPRGDSTTTQGPPKVAAPIVGAPSRMAEVEPGPRRARVRKREAEAEPATVRARLVDDGCWPLWRVPGLLWGSDFGFLRGFLQKPVLAAGFGVP